MTDQQHPITPPLELAQQWWATETRGPYGLNLLTLATKAARWGADQELEACANWLADPCAADMASLAKDLRYSRRPQSPSLAEQALTQLDSLHTDLRAHGLGADTDAIRRALERLQELENHQ